MPDPFRAYVVLPGGTLYWDMAHMGGKGDHYDPNGKPGTHIIHVREDGTWWLEYDPTVVDPVAQAAAEAAPQPSRPRAKSKKVSRPISRP